VHHRAHNYAPTGTSEHDMYEHVRISIRDGGWHRYTGYIMHRGFYLV